MTVEEESRGHLIIFSSSLSSSIYCLLSECTLGLDN